MKQIRNRHNSNQVNCSVSFYKLMEARLKGVSLDELVLIIIFNEVLFLN